MNGDIEWALFVFLKQCLEKKDINDKKVSRENRNERRRKASLKNKLKKND
jgi:hypothetical protein